MSIERNQRKIKVLHYIAGFLYGGIESMFLNWYEHIDKNKIEFELLKRTQDDNTDELRRFQAMGGIVHKLKTLSAGSIFDFRKSVKDFFATHHDYDILHVHGSNDPFVFQYAKKYGIKVVILHSHAALVNKKTGYRHLKTVFDLINRPYVDHYFACSKKAGEYRFGKKDVQNHKVKIINNAIQVSNFIFDQKTRDEYRAQLKIEGKFVVGHVGRMTFQKNFPLLINIFYQVAKKNDNAILLLVGDGPDYPVIKHQVYELGLESKVLFLGIRTDVTKLLQAMDVFLLPSRWEGLPVTVIEAQATGIKCVVADTITDEAAITPNIQFIPLNKPEEFWADCIIKHSNGYERKNMAQTIAQAGYDIETQVKELERLYREMIT